MVDLEHHFGCAPGPAVGSLIPLRAFRQLGFDVALLETYGCTTVPFNGVSVSVFELEALLILCKGIL